MPAGVRVPDVVDEAMPVQDTVSLPSLEKCTSRPARSPGTLRPTMGSPSHRSMVKCFLSCAWLTLKTKLNLDRYSAPPTWRKCDSMAAICSAFIAPLPVPKLLEASGPSTPVPGALPSFCNCRHPAGLAASGNSCMASSTCGWLLVSVIMRKMSGRWRMNCFIFRLRLEARWSADQAACTGPQDATRLRSTGLPGPQLRRNTASERKKCSAEPSMQGCGCASLPMPMAASQPWRVSTSM
mmetsp:Transcript_23332/g.48571  ORF Transcript_23332/g.48571 Transcript_23332/m.48571 type:complete len:239 (+) Transcript_23332:865-1581(+)